METIVSDLQNTASGSEAFLTSCAAEAWRDGNREDQRKNHEQKEREKIEKKTQGGMKNEGQWKGMMRMMEGNVEKDDERNNE